MELIRDQRGDILRRPAGGALVEIIEVTDSPDPEVIVPNEVRLNGTRLLVPADEPIVVHEMDLGSQDLVRVTLTLYARRVVVGAEGRES